MGTEVIQWITPNNIVGFSSVPPPGAGPWPQFGRIGSQVGAGAAIQMPLFLAELPPRHYGGSVSHPTVTAFKKAPGSLTNQGSRGFLAVYVDTLWTLINRIANPSLPRPLTANLVQGGPHRVAGVAEGEQAALGPPVELIVAAGDRLVAVVGRP